MNVWMDEYMNGRMNRNGKKNLKLKYGSRVKQGNYNWKKTVLSKHLQFQVLGATFFFDLISVNEMGAVKNV